VSVESGKRCCAVTIEKDKTIKRMDCG